MEESKYKSAPKKALFALMLFIPKIFGLLKLWNFLTNKKKIYEPKEIFLNWFLVIMIIIFFISLMVWVSIFQEVNTLVKNKSKLKLVEETLNKWGTSIFFTSVSLVILSPIKMWFKSKRKQQRMEKFKNEIN